MKASYPESEDLQYRQNKDGFSLKRWLGRMVQLWPWFVLSLGLCLALTYLYLRYTNPTYSAVSSIVVKDEKKGAEMMDNSMMKEIGLGGNNKLVENEIEILRSYDLMEAVVNNLQLFVSMQHVGSIRDVDVYGDDLPFKLVVVNPVTVKERHQWEIKDTAQGILFKETKEKAPVFIGYGQNFEASGIRFWVSQDTLFTGARSSKYHATISPPSETAVVYGRKLSVEAASKVATVINLEIKDSHQQRAIATLQSLINIYNVQGVEDKNRVTDNTIDFLTERLQVVAGELQGVESSVEKFKSENRVTDLSADAQQYLDLSQHVDIQKAESQTQWHIIDALEKDLLANQENPKLVPSTLGINEPTLEALIAKHNELVLSKERLEKVSGPKNPALIDVNEQIKEIRSRLISNVGSLKQAYKISLNDIDEKNLQLNSRIRSVPLLERKLVQITRNQTVQEQLYAFLLQKREEAAITRASNIADSRTILRARSLGQVAPKPGMVWAFGVLLGLLIPVVLFGFRDYMNNKIGDTREVQQQMDIPLLGTIPHIKKMQGPIVINKRARSAAAEMIRNIRTAITYTNNGKPVKKILITSFQQGEGKSFASLNLGASYALLHKKTVILEFDLRKPRLAKNMKLNTKKGISNILAGRATLDDLLVEIPDHGGNLFLLPAGSLPPNPAELISSDNMGKLMQTLESRFDYIIIDSPPLNVVTDATLLQKYADITVIVLRQNYTSRHVYEKLNEKIAEHPDQRIYILLNDTGRSKRYKDKYGYSNGYYHDKDFEISDEAAFEEQPDAATLN